MPDFASLRAFRPSAPITRAAKNRSKAVFIARAMGADPTASPVTGECSTVELRPHEDKIAEILFFYKSFPSADEWN